MRLHMRIYIVLLNIYVQYYYIYRLFLDARFEDIRQLEIAYVCMFLNDVYAHTTLYAGRFRRAL